MQFGNNNENVNYYNNNTNSKFNLQKAILQFIKEIQISEKKHQKVRILQDNTGCQENKVLVTAFPKLAPAKCLVLISTKFINQGQSKANDEMFLYFSVVYLHHKNQNDVCTFLLDIPLFKNS